VCDCVFLFFAFVRLPQFFVLFGFFLVFLSATKPEQCLVEKFGSVAHCAACFFPPFVGPWTFLASTPNDPNHQTDNVHNILLFYLLFVWSGDLFKIFVTNALTTYLF
jgi:hypothetical protein